MKLKNYYKCWSDKKMKKKELYVCEICGAEYDR